MRTNGIKRELQKLQRTIKKQPRVWKFHGRRIVRADEWKWGDWSKLPDSCSILMVYGKTVPDDYLRDYAALMEKLEDPTYGKTICWSCVIHRAEDAKKELDRLWEHIEWYDNHWNRSTSTTPAASEMKWYHYNEPSIIDVADYDDIIRAIDDGRLGRIIDEHTRYPKETNCEIWAL